MWVSKKNRVYKNTLCIYSSAVRNIKPQTQEKRFSIIVKSLNDEDEEKNKGKIQWEFLIHTWELESV